MFTGIVQEIGELIEVERSAGGVRLRVRAPLSTRELNINDSVAINGVCQTVVAKTATDFSVQAVEETLKKTTLGRMKPMARVHLELPVRLSDRLGGHLVLGHVDAVGILRLIEKQASSWLLSIEYPREFSKYIIPVGSIAVDGISLTVASLQDHAFVVSIIPHTLQKTTLASAQIGQELNLEFDVLGKYVERLLQQREGRELTWEKLTSWGFET